MHIYNGLTSRSEYGPILQRMQIRCSENGSIFKDFLRAITRRGGYTAGLRLIVQSSQIFSFVQVAQTRLTNRHGRPNIELCRDEPAHRSAHRQVMQPQVSTKSSHVATGQHTVKSCSHRSEHSQVMQQSSHAATGQHTVKSCSHRSAHSKVMQPQVSTQSSHAATGQHTVKSCSHRSARSQVMQPQVRTQSSHAATGSWLPFIDANG